MSEELEAALATISAELSATQQLVTMLPVQHSLDRSRTEPSRAIDELEREFARILAELSDGAANAVDKQHFTLVREALEAQLDSACQLAHALAFSATQNETR
ncbi:hypothetical protein [Methylorubrum sp. POS3]|uniref:hypothetical protein n=1 Tax=Methylorubrum sp. POS3 TaxID=2998492 RepID=UPI00372C2B69